MEIIVRKCNNVNINNNKKNSSNTKNISFINKNR